MSVSRPALALAAAITLAAVPVAGARTPVPVVDRGVDRQNDPVANVRERDLGDGYFMSGSSQFSEPGFAALLDLLASKGSYNPELHYFVDVDLRQEAHGFVNGHAIRWMDADDPDLIKYDWVNIGQPRDTVLATERSWLQALTGQTAFFVKAGPSTLAGFTFSTAVTSPGLTEEEVVTRALGAGHYLRLTVPDHLMPESDAEIDRFVATMADVHRAAAEAKKKPWIHFHCAAGQGRTTTFMALYDLYVKIIVRGLKVDLLAPSTAPSPLPRRFEDFEALLLSQKDAQTLISPTGKGGADLTFTGAVKVAQKDETRGLGAMDRFRFIANYQWYLRQTGATRPWSQYAAERTCSLVPYQRSESGTYRYCR